MLSQIRRTSALARLIILDGVRRHALIGLILFALAGITSGLFFFDLIPRDVGRAVNDFLFSITWLTGFIFLLFHGVQVMAWDNERGTLHTFLARPISRTEYAIALFLGLAVLLLALNLILGTFGWLVLSFVKRSVDASYFQQLSMSFFFLAGAGLYWIQLTILSIILLFSSAVRGTFPVLLLTLCYYFICTGLPVVRESLMQRGTSDSSHSLHALLKWMTAFFPDLSWLDFKTLVATTDPTPITSQMVLPFVLSSLYIIIALWLACFIYERRDMQ